MKMRGAPARTRCKTGGVARQGPRGQGVLEGAKGMIHGVPCGAGMPYKTAEICARYGVYYSPIVSSARAFRALWKRAYHRFPEWLGAVVYEDPWLAGGHNGLSNSEDPQKPEDPLPRVAALRQIMTESGVAKTPIIIAGGGRGFRA